MHLLTSTEKMLAADAGIILSKNRIIQSVYNSFGGLADAYRTKVSCLPSDVVRLHPKISRGENYLGLPWVMLDYPRAFSGADFFAIRTMFWWGNDFSIHLLLGGNKMKLLNIDAIPEDWYFSIAENPWQHQLDSALFLPAKTVSATNLEQQERRGFYKLSCYLPLVEWDKSALFLLSKFDDIMSMV